jgi:hypothetical protein
MHLFAIGSLQRTKGAGAIGADNSLNNIPCLTAGIQ